MTGSVLREPLSVTPTAGAAHADSLHRVHQEDMCQAFAIPPTRKYQDEGGPGIRDIVGLLAENSSLPREDIATFLVSVVYNFLIAGTDAHAKD